MPRTAPLRSLAPLTAIALLTMTMGQPAHAGWLDGLKRFLGAPVANAPGADAALFRITPLAPGEVAYVDTSATKGSARMPLAIQTPLLDKFATYDMVERSREFGTVMGRARLDERYAQSYARSTRPAKGQAGPPPESVLLSGDPRSGKTFLTYRQAQLIADNNVRLGNGAAGAIPVTIRNLDINRIFSQRINPNPYTPTTETPTNRIHTIINEVSTNNAEVRRTGRGSYIVLHIERFGELMTGGANEGDRIVVANAIRDAIADGRIIVHGEATVEEASRFASTMPSANRKMVNLQVNLPEKGAEVAHMARLIAQRAELEHGIYISQGAVDRALELSARANRGHARLADVETMLKRAAEMIRVEMSTTGPMQLADVRTKLQTLRGELAAVTRETTLAHNDPRTAERIAGLHRTIEETHGTLEALEAANRDHRQGIPGNAVRQLRQSLEAIERRIERSASGAPANLLADRARFQTQIQRAEQAALNISQWVRGHYVNDGTTMRPIVGPQTVGAAYAQINNRDEAFHAEGQMMRLMSMAERLAKRVRGQDEAISVVVRDQVLRATGLFGGRGIPAYIFDGDTGVGKTELAKALAEELFGSEDAMAVIAANTLHDSYGVTGAVLGASPGLIGSDQSNPIKDAFRRRPHNVVLVDEVEKAHPSIWDLFMGAADEGTLRMNDNTVIDMRGSVLVFTTNLGNGHMREIRNVLQARLVHIDSELGRLDIAMANANSALDTKYNEHGRDANHPQVTLALEEVRRVDAERKNWLTHRADVERRWKTHADGYNQDWAQIRPEILARAKRVQFNALGKDITTDIMNLMVQKNLIKPALENGLQVTIDPSAIARLAEDGREAAVGVRGLQDVLKESAAPLIAYTVSRMRAAEEFLRFRTRAFMNLSEGSLVNQTHFNINLVQVTREEFLDSSYFSGGEEALEGLPEVLQALELTLANCPMELNSEVPEGYRLSQKRHLWPAEGLGARSPRAPEMPERLEHIGTHPLATTPPAAPAAPSGGGEPPPVN